MTKVSTQNIKMKKNTINTFTSKHSIFWIMMSGFMGLIFVRNTIISFPVIILLVYACLMGALADHNEIMALAVSFIPFSAAFQYRYALLVLIAIYFVKYPQTTKQISVSSYITLILLMIWELVHGLMPFEFSFVVYLQYFAELIFCTCVISLNNRKFDFAFISRVLAITTVFSCCVVLINLLRSTGFDISSILLEGKYRLGASRLDVSSFSMDHNPNSLGFMCNMATAALLLKNKISKINFVDLALMAILSFFGCLTLSRSFVVCFVFLLALYLLSMESGAKKGIKKVIVVAVIAGTIIVLMRGIIPNVFMALLDRFSEKDISNGREELFIEYLAFSFSSFSNLFLGIGLQGIVDKVSSQGYTHIDQVPHNGIQELMVLWGIPGVILFGAFIYIMICSSRKINTKHTLANWIPLALLMFMIQSGQMVTSGYKMLMLLLVYIVFCVNFDGEDENETFERF